MSIPRSLFRLLTLTGVVTAFAGYLGAQEQPFRFAGTRCDPTPVLHCPDKDCPPDRVINPGPVVEMKTRRTYFLDYPCDLQPGEKVTFILSLHGAGSYGNWQRHYFPLIDYKDKYRLVIATPNSPTQVWSSADDEYLQNIVNFVVGQIGKENIKAFWLVGHSQGGLTSNRIIRTDFFKDKVDGWLSLSGGRLGGNPGRAGNFGPPRTATTSAGPLTPTGTPGGGASSTVAPAGSGMSAAAVALRELPPFDFSHIYAIGQREIDEKGVPETSELARKYNCGPRSKPQEVVDTKAGYVYDSRPREKPNPAWGLLPGPGKAQVYTFPGCRDGLIVADVVRLEKGHTEGLEPKITEELIKLMLSAKGGKITK